MIDLFDWLVCGCGAGTARAQAAARTKRRVGDEVVIAAPFSPKRSGLTQDVSIARAAPIRAGATDVAHTSRYSCAPTREIPASQRIVELYTLDISQAFGQEVDEVDPRRRES
jgi:hypothetical protein